MRPTVQLAGREIHLFRLCGVAGLALAAPVALALAAAHGQSLVVEAAVVVLAVALFFGLAWTTRTLTGRASLTYYHHQAAVLIGAWAALRIAGQPVLPYLDATAVGLGVFLACGRIGCLCAGCCHGRPAARGIRYSPAHLVPRGLVGVPLFPVQAVESAATALLAAAGAVTVLAGAPAGTALTVFLVGYATVRFCLEELRGDPMRPRLAGLSEAQWTSVAVVLIFLGPWALPAVAIGVVAVRWRRALPARDLCAIATALNALPAAGGPEILEVDGVRVSSGRTAGVVHYTVSGPPDVVQRRAAVGELVARLRHPGASARAVVGEGALHVLVEGRQ